MGMVILKAVGFASGLAAALGVYYQHIVVPTIAVHEEQIARLRAVDEKLRVSLKNH